MMLMGERLSEFEAEEVMAEIDVDASGSIQAAELMDKLKQFGVGFLLFMYVNPMNNNCLLFRT